MFSKVLKNLRTSKGLSQAELSKILGVAQQTVGKWERDIAYPNIDTMKKIAKFFNVTTDYLLGNDVPVSVKTNTDQQQQGSAILLRAQEKLPDEKLKELENMAQYFLDNYGKDK